VIHAVGPAWGEGDEDKKLADAVSGSLSVADELELTSISMPAISTGIFGFPKNRAAKIIFKTIQEYFDKRKSGLKIVRLVLLDQSTVDEFIEEWKMENGE
jgi:O-acetyl-ADP-ribose deacetylase (regulator of RNase III)